MSLSIHLRWAVKTAVAESDEAEALPEEGWEPFAVAAYPTRPHLLYLRKQIGKWAE